MHPSQSLEPQGRPPAGADVILKPASEQDLPSVNRVIAASIRTWSLPDRVRRLAEPSLHYDDSDLRFMSGVVAEDDALGACAVAMWEPAGERDAATDRRTLLLHGLYVVPERQRRGLGSRLLAYAEEWSRACGFEGTVARPWPQAHAFFRGRGFEPLKAAVGASCDSRLLWKPVA